MKSKNRTSLILLVTALLIAPLATAEKEHKEAHQHKPYVGSVQLEKMKTLAGTWKGTSTMEAGKPVTVEYRISSAGSTVVETWFPGAPDEMVSVYHDADGKLEMTHYCALHNQPRMSLRKNAGDQIDLVYSGGENIDVKKDAHMHAVKFSFPEKGKMVQNWAFYDAGENKGINTMTLSKAP